MTTSDIENISLVCVSSPGLGQLRMNEKFARIEILCDLFALNNDDTVIVCDQEGEEIALSDAQPLPSNLSILNEKFLADAEHEHDANCVMHNHDDTNLSAPVHCNVQCEFGRWMRQRMQLAATQRAALLTRLCRETVTEQRRYLYQTPLDLQRVLDSRVLDALQQHDGEQTARVKALATCVAQRTELYRVPLFSSAFCDDLIDEVRHIEAQHFPLSRPNTMNNYGLILDQIGMTQTLAELRERVAVPILRALYADARHAQINQIASHHAFIVQYAAAAAAADKECAAPAGQKGDSELGFHYDQSLFTFNVCLGREFRGSSLYFSGLLEDESTHDEMIQVEHEVGHALVHIGKHRHGANKITAGERFNLVLWLQE